MKLFQIAIVSIAVLVPLSFASSQAPPATSPATPPPGATQSEAAPSAGQTAVPAPTAIISPLEPQPAGPLPTALELFKKGIEAIGGEAAIRKHTSMVTKGTLSMPMAGMSGKLEIFTTTPNKILTTMEFPGVGKITQGFDGSVGWSMNPMMGPQLVEGPMLEELKSTSDMYKDLDPSKMWAKAQTKGAVNFGGVPCYEITVSGGPGDGSLFYEIQTGLARGMMLTVNSPMGKVPSTTIMSDYKEFDGVKIATRTDVEAMNMKQVLLVDSISYAPVDPSLFQLPPEIQALVSTSKQPAAAGDTKKPANRIRIKPNSESANTAKNPTAPTPSSPSNNPSATPPASSGPSSTTPQTAPPAPPAQTAPPAGGNPSFQQLNIAQSLAIPVGFNAS